MDELQRNLWCVHYPFCLDVHVRYCKRKFTCLRCKRYKPIHLEAEEVIEDALNCAQFLHALFFGKLSEEGEVEKDTEGLDYVRIPLNLIRSFQNALFLFAGNAQALINIGNQMSKLGDDLKSRIPEGEQNDLIE
jgi:hypothetical protein